MNNVAHALLLQPERDERWTVERFDGVHLTPPHSSLYGWGGTLQSPTYQEARGFWTVPEEERGMPSNAAARRLGAEKPEVVQAFFDGCDVKHGEQTIHHYGLKEVMQ
ncbi:hypothetical protein PPROV_000930400 [Pycnococcus provasolii]|uniref:Uncharacterized protein n=1 Tax=Pycnococcus provasolii TaxID=41880 RepID=A0A830HV01_9CHLO|nr:hypothetical protein PPROV_000930400 [Pycnococcus provasolii]